MLEQEIKLSYPDAEAAREAVVTAGGRLVTPRRLIDDQLFDTEDRRLRRTGTALRVRRDAERAFLTFKGPVKPGLVKVREELETRVGEASTAEAVLTSLGFKPVFRSQKYREEYQIEAALLTVDETPAGVFVEIEADEAAIHHVAALLGRSPADYRLESYPALWRQRCLERGLPIGSFMLFEPGEP